MGCCKEKEESCACAELNPEQEVCGCACSDTPSEDIYDFMCMYRKLSDLLDQNSPLDIISGIMIYAERASAADEIAGNPKRVEAWNLLAEKLSDVIGN